MYGTSDTNGYSLAPIPGILTDYNNNLKATGSLPSAYAFDLYANAYATLQYLENELLAEGENNKSILIQETGAALNLFLNQNPQVITLNLGTASERNALAACGLVLTVVNSSPGGGSDSIQVGP